MFDSRIDLEIMADMTLWVCLSVFALMTVLLIRGLDFFRRCKICLLLPVLLLFAAAAFCLPRLKLDDSPERWMPRSSVEAWKEFDRHFSHSDTIGIAVHFREQFREKDARFLSQLHEALQSVEGIVRVIDMSVAARDVEDVPLTEILKTPADPQNDPYAMYRGVLFDDPRQWRSKTGKEQDAADDLKDRTLIVYLELDTGRKAVDSGRSDSQERERRLQIVRQVYEVLKRFQRSDVSFHPAGAVVIQYELERMARRIVRIFVPLSLLLAFVALGISFRSLMPVCLAVSAAIWSVTVLLGGVVWAGWSLNVVTVGGPILMFVIVIATTIHFAHAEAAPDLSLQHESSVPLHRMPGSNQDTPADALPAENPDGLESGETQEEHPSAVQNKTENPTATQKKTESQTAAHKPVDPIPEEKKASFVRWVAVPCLGAAVTTGVGFLMLTFNELQPIREMGVELCVGAVLAFLGVYAMWLWLPAGKPVGGRWIYPRRLRRWYAAVIAHPRAILLLMGGGMVFLAASATRIRTDPDPFSFFRPDSQMARSLRHISQRQFGMYLLDVALIPRKTGGETDGPDQLTPRQWQAARAFQQKIARRPEVRNVVSTMNFREQQQRLSQGLQPGKLSDRQLRRLMTFSRTFENWLYDQAGEGALRITFKVDDRGEGFRDLLDEVRRELPRDQFECLYTGTAADMVVLAEGLVGGLLWGLSTAFVVMAAVCLLWFRSVRLTLLAFFPNLFPVLFILGIMGLFGVTLNSGSAMVATIALGIALNDTVHFVLHYRGRREEGEDVRQAVEDTYAEIGRPIILTSVVNCFGFAIFLLSEFQPMADFGLLTGLAMLAALAGDLILLPVLLTAFDRRNEVMQDKAKKR